MAKKNHSELMNSINELRASILSAPENELDDLMRDLWDQANKEMILEKEAPLEVNRLRARFNSNFFLGMSHLLITTRYLR